MNLSNKISDIKNIPRFFKRYSFLIASLFFILLLLFVTIIPYFLTFSPLFEDRTINPFVEPQTSYVPWEGGNQHQSQSDFRVTVLLISIDIKKTQTFSIFFDITAPIIAENNSIIDHDYELYSFDQQLYSSGKTYFGDIGSYSEGLYYSSFGYVEKFPYDSYFIIYTFTGLKNVSVVENEQIFVQAGCKSSDWNQNLYVSSPKENGKDLLIITLKIKRTTTTIISEISLLLLILGGIFITAIVCDPVAKFSEEEDSKEINDKISQNQKFRIDTAKWILAFAFANLIFVETAFPLMTMKMTMTISALMISGSFYLSSKSQGDKWGYLNFCIAVVAGGICLATFILCII